MYKLVTYTTFKEDLDHLWRDNESAAADITALVGELEGNQDALDWLNVDNHTNEKFSVSGWWWFQNKGFNVFRLAEGYDVAEWGEYRLIYTFDGRTRVYFLLAVMPRDVNYEKSKTLTDRIEAAYRAIGIPLLPRGR